MKIDELSFLLLEDDKELADDLIETLKLYCKKVYYAPKIKKAHELIKEKNIDIIISDIHLKEENGLNFLEELKENNCKIPMIILSGFDNKEFLFRAINLRVVEYIVKPLDINKLESALHKCEKYIKYSKESLWHLLDDVIFDSNNRVVYNEDEEFSLTAREYDFLKMAKKYPNQLITPSMIEHYVFYDEVLTIASLKNLIFRLRKKIGSNTIVTIPNMGYKVLHKK